MTTPLQPAAAPTEPQPDFSDPLQPEDDMSEASGLRHSSLRHSFIATRSGLVEPTRMRRGPNYDLRYRLGLGLLILGWFLPLLTPLESWMLTELKYHLYPTSLAWFGGLVPYVAIAVFVAGWLLLPGRATRRIVAAVLGAVALAASVFLQWLDVLTGEVGQSADRGFASDG